MFIRSTAHRSMKWVGKYSGKDEFQAPDGTRWRVDSMPTLDDGQRAAFTAWKKSNKGSHG